MANLHFIYGPMGSSKTAQALMQRYNFIEHGKTVLFLKSEYDTRDGAQIIKSRVGIEAPVTTFGPNDNLINIFSKNLSKIDCIIVDEVELATTTQVEQLKYLAEELDVTVYAYGIRTDFKTKLFEGSKRLFELADVITQLECLCSCGKPAIVNARYKDKKVQYKGPRIVIGGNERYTSLCYSCWKKGQLK